MFLDRVSFPEFCNLLKSAFVTFHALGIHRYRLNVYQDPKPGSKVERSWLWVARLLSALDDRFRPDWRSFVAATDDSRPILHIDDASYSGRQLMTGINCYTSRGYKHHILEMRSETT